MSSDVTRGEAPVLVPSKGGRWLHSHRPDRRRLRAVADRRGRRPRRAADRGPALHLGLARGPGPRRPWSAAGRIAYLRSTPTEPPDLWLLDSRRLGVVEAAAADPLNETSSTTSTCASRSSATATVDGHDIQGWFLPAGDGARPLVVEIHGGPHTLYGWSPVWEFQVLAAAGIGVFYCNPRGSEGYGEAFNDANHRDWGPGPMRDVLAGVDALVADGLADPDRLGVTGGSYGGYLTNWIVGHDDRFRAAMTCRSVNEMSVLFTTGDISGGDWARLEFESTPWDRPGLLTARSRRSPTPTGSGRRC